LITVIDSIFCVFCAVFAMVTDVEVWVTWNEVSTRYVRKHTRAKLPWRKWQVDTCQPARTASKQASTSYQMPIRNANCSMHCTVKQASC